MKTLTLRIDDNTYELIKMAAEGQKRNISNFLEFATMQYLTMSQYVDDHEMNEILEDENLISRLEQAEEEINKGEYTVVDI